MHAHVAMTIQECTESESEDPFSHLVNSVEAYERPFLLLRLFTTSSVLVTMFRIYCILHFECNATYLGRASITVLDAG